MNTAKILAAFIGRLPVTEIDELRKAQYNGVHAGMNLGTSAQIAAHEELDNACAGAVGCIGEHDLEIIESIVRREAGGGPKPYIEVRRDRVYGNYTIYPVCDQAQKFAAIAGTKTLTQGTLDIIKSMGIEVRVTGVDSIT